MQVRILEVRDEGTFISVVAVRMFPETGPDGRQYDRQKYLLRRVGYPCDDPDRAQVLLARANGDGHAYSDPYQWVGSRTMQWAHVWILEHWAELRDGDVVDAEFAAGLREAPRQSERETE
jgi:hypothetical protein